MISLIENITCVEVRIQSMSSGNPGHTQKSLKVNVYSGIIVKKVIFSQSI